MRPLIFLPYRFRWVFCQLEVLRHCIPASIRKTLDQLPKSLDDTYLRVLRQIPQANQAHAHRMLQCLVVAVRPLEVAELAELLAFEFDEAQGGIPEYCPALRLDNQTQAVLSTCSSLVTIINERSPDRQVVQFSHFSVKEFLVSNRLAPSLGDISQYNIRLKSAHITLTQACLGLLLHSDDSITSKIVERSPLAGYAARHWAEHAQYEDVASHVKDGMETLFDADKPHFEAWVGIYDIDPRISWQPISGHPSPLYYSVLCGFYDLAEHLTITHPEYVNAFGGQYQFPLLAALGRGHVEAAELLLKHGAEIDVRGVWGRTMLLIAISCLDVNDILLDIVKFLLTHGADVNARDDDFKGSLSLAGEVYGGKVAAMLLKHGVDVNSQDDYGKTPLHRLVEAATYSYKDYSNDVPLLLEHGAEVNIRDKDNQTPLLLAMQGRQFKIARILIEHGADASVEDKNGKNLLHLVLQPASYIRDEDDVLDLAQSLLKHGVEVNRRDKDNQTPLLLAIKFSWFKVARILVEHGADANTEDKSGKNLLHLLLSDRYIGDEDDFLDHALFLLKHGVEVNRRDEDNQTPLLLAIKSRWFKTARILVEHGADANVEDERGKALLHILLSDNGSVPPEYKLIFVNRQKIPLSDRYIDDEEYVFDHVLFLLKHGAEVNRRDKDNQTPLLLAMDFRWFKTARILVEHGADANTEDERGETLLHVLLSDIYIVEDDDFLDLVLFILKNGAEVNKRDEDNRTPLLLAMDLSRFKTARILVEHGADANTENVIGKTLLHILILSNSDICDEDYVLNLVLLLLRHGAEVDKRDYYGNPTPLHLAIQMNRFRLAGILVEHGADPIAENDEGKTPLHMLSESIIDDEDDVHHVLDHALLLLNHGAEVNRRDNDKETPLHLAIRRDWFNLAGIFLEYGADPVAENNKGQTPLHILLENDGDDVQNLVPSPVASYSTCGRVEMARTLLGRRGANASAKDALGQTPLHMVSRGAYISQEDDVCIAKLLLEHGADVNAQDNNHETPLDLASHHGKLEIAALLLHYNDKDGAKVDQGPSPNQPQLEVANRHEKPALGT